MPSGQLTVTLLALLAALLWGVAPVFGKAGLGSVDPGTALLVRVFGVALVLAVWALATGAFARLGTVGWRPAALLVGEGVLASIAGQLAYYYALKLGEASRAVPIGATYPLVTVLIAAGFLGESLTWTKAGGALLVVAGVWLLQR